MARVQLVFDGSARGALSAARQTREGLQGVRREARGASDDLGKATRGVLAGSGAFRSFARSIAFASGAFLGAAGFTAVLRSSISAAEDLDDVLDRSQVVFRSHAREVQAWAKTAADSIGLARSEALGFANEVGTRFKGLGVAGAAVSEYSKRIVQLSVDIGELQSKDPASFVEAFDAALTGRTRGLKQFGVFIDEDRIAAEALSDGMVKAAVDTGKLEEAQTRLAIAEARLGKATREYGADSTQAAQSRLTLRSAEEGLSKALAGKLPELTAAQKAEAVYRLTLKQTADAQGFYAKQSGDADVQTRRLRAQLTNIEAEIGTALLPTVVKITGAIADWLSKSENQEKITGAVTTAVQKMTKFVQAATPIVQSFVGWVEKAVDAVGGMKNALELLAGAVILKKLATLRIALAGIGTTWKINLQLIGAVAIGAALDALQQKLNAATGYKDPATSGGRVALGHNIVYNPETGGFEATGRGGRGGTIPVSEEIAAKQLGVSLQQLHAMVTKILQGAKASVDAAAAAVGGSVPALISGAKVQLPTSQRPTHETAGLPGFPAVDIFATPGTAILAPEDGIVTRISGHEPTEAPPQGQGGPWGLSIYYLGTETGNTYFMTHLVKVARPGRYAKGDVIGLIGDYPGGADHVHFGIHQGRAPEAFVGSGLFNPSDYLAAPKGGSAPTRTGATAGGGVPPVPRTGPLHVGIPPKAPGAPPSIQERLDAAFGIKAARAERTAGLSDDATVIAAEIRWTRQQLENPKLDPADRLDLEQLLTDLLHKAADIADDQHKQQQQAADRIAARIHGIGPPGHPAGFAQIREDIAAVHVADVATAARIHGIGPPGHPASRADLGLDAAAVRDLERGARQAAVSGASAFAQAWEAQKQRLRAITRGVNFADLILEGLKDLPNRVEITVGQDIFGRPIASSVAKVKERIAQLIEIIRTGSAEAREKAIAELSGLASGVGQAMDDAAQAAEDADLASRLADAITTGLGQLPATVQLAWGEDPFGRPLQHSVDETRRHIAELVEIIRTGTAEARAAALAELNQIASGIGAALSNAAAQASSAFQTAFGRLGSTLLSGFDRETQSTVAGLQRQIADQIQALQQETAERIQRMQRELQRDIDRIEAAGRLPTPSESKLQQLEAAHEAELAARELADAQKALRDAKTPEERLQAQQRLADIAYQRQITNLQKQADAERKARDESTQAQIQALRDREQAAEQALQAETAAQIQALQDQLAAQVQSYEDQRAAQRQWLEDQLLAWQTNILNGTATMDDFIKWLQGQGANGVLQGVPIGDPVAAMGDAGDAQGGAYADGFIAQLQRAYQAWLDFMAAIAAGNTALPPPGTGADTGGDQSGHGRPHFQRGGRVPGVYVGRQDTILARVTPGEQVIDRRDSLRLAAFLDSVERGAFSGGGPTVAIGRLTTYGGTERQVHESFARALEPFRRRIVSYPSPR